ncbi:MAG: leucyl aminopeptidase [Candidatus Doudnabacteria bacterium]|nr:leucyl aminopeptidase [Candidatus Doudnabacteria bacterium]
MKLRLTKQLNKSDLTIIPLFAKKQPAEEFKVLGLQDFTGKANETHVVYSENLGRMMLLGLGENKNFNPASLRTAIQTAVSASKKFKTSSLQILLRDLRELQSPDAVEIISFAAVFASYSFNYYKQEKEKINLENIYLAVPRITKAMEKAIARGSMVASAANKARDLANHPANIATPAHLAQHAKLIADKYRLKLKVLDAKDIKKENMGLLLGVSRGSDEPPKFIVIEYLPKKSSNQNPIVLIGKGLTFDSGGISIKPAERMEEMKYDMCGGATVLGIIEAAAQLKLKTSLVGLIPSAENLLSGRATKPGDILTSMSGKTVEIINTDAEGRLILADAITYAKKHYQPKLILDYATLTGAIIIALGDELTGAFGNSEKYNQQLTKAAKATGEKLWLMPLPNEYQDQLKSQIADLKNTGDKGLGGAITASLFLLSFVDKTPWIHFDIAGTAWTVKSRPHMPAGASGWGVYHGIKFLENL